MTPPFDTDFYKQESPYSEDHQVIHFKEHLIQQVLDVHSGFYFPKAFKTSESRMDRKDFSAIHKLFFFQKMYSPKKLGNSYH